MGVFDDILSGVPQEDLAVIDKYPALRQTVENLHTSNQAWAGWAERNWDSERNATHREVALLDRVAELEEGGAGADMTFDQIITAAKDEKHPLRQAVSQIANDQVANFAAGAEAFMGMTAHLPVQHFAEFGDPKFTIQGLIGYMQQNKLNDPQLAYDRMVEPKRAELRQKAEAEAAEKRAQELKEAEERGIQRGRQEAGMSGAGRSIPTDQGGDQNMGVLQAKIYAEQKGQTPQVDPGPGKLGDDIVAMEGYRELVEARNRPN